MIIAKIVPRRVLHRANASLRPISVGVRGLVENSDGAMLLVRHTYVAGWHFPGGAVDPGETVYEAVARETREETGIIIAPAPQLLGVFHNARFSRRDHVVFFRCMEQSAAEGFAGSPEIAEARYFAADALPADLSAGTARRIAELRGEAPAAMQW